MSTFQQAWPGIFVLTCFEMKLITSHQVKQDGEATKARNEVPFSLSLL